MNGLEQMIYPYTGANGSHRRFRGKYIWLNGSSYLLHAAKDQLAAHLGRQMSPGTAAVGIATAGGTTWLKGIQVPRDDATFMLRDMPGFLALVQRQIIVGVHRALIDYLFELLTEVLQIASLTLDEKQQKLIRNHNLNVPELIQTFIRIRLPVAEPGQETELQLLTLRRNILEHKAGRVTSKYIDLVGAPATLKVGDQLPVDSEMAGDCLSFASVVAMRLNQRAIERWPALEGAK